MTKGLEVDRSNQLDSLWTWPDRSRAGGVLLFLTVVVLYGLGSWLALLLIEASALQSVFFIPAGITVAFLLRLPRRLWWVVLVGAALTEVVMDLAGGFSTGESLGYAIANTVEPLVGASIVTAACGSLDLARSRHLMWFSFGAVLFGPALGASFGATADRVFAGDAFLTTFGQWWLGDALGVILVAGAILAWGSSRDRRALISLGGIGLVAGAMALTVAIFRLTDLPLIFSVLIGVVVAGVVFGVRAVAVTSLAVALTIAVMVATDPGVLILGMTPVSALVLIKLQIAIFTLAGLLIAAESHERELAVGDAARSALEAKTHEQERRREQELGKRVQRGLLPDRLIARRGVDIAARYEAAGDSLEVGGDWYDTIQLDESRVGLVVGDIVGHGIESMISMGRLRTALAALALHNDDPATLLTELDEFAGGPDGTKFATVFYAIIDFGNQLIQYASAGHPPGLMLDPSGHPTWLDQGQGEPLTGTSALRRRASIRFEPGSSVILYSDGLIERRGESLSDGMRRLESLAAQLADRPANAMCNELFEGLTAQTDEVDDAVVLVTRIGVDRFEYHEVFPAVPHELRNMRSSIRSWATARGIHESTADDLLIAVGEATSNAVRHAYHESTTGDVAVRIELVDGYLRVRVSDGGRWRPPLGAADTPGMGTTLLQKLTYGLEIVPADGGTDVTFRIPARPHLSPDGGDSSEVAR